MARLHRRYSKRRRSSQDSSPKRNPPLLADLGEWVLPGFAGFGLTRFLTRIATTEVAKRKPSWGKHVGAVTSIGTFLAAWFLAHRWKLIAKYHTPVTVGSAIAALQSLIQLYVPGLGWMIADASPELGAGADADQLAMPQPQMPMLVAVNEDPNEYTYNDTYDPGRYNKAGQSPPFVPPGAPRPQSQEQDLSDLAIDDAIGQSQNLGVFSAN